MQETKLNGESLDILSENVSKLKELFPEVVTEDKIDFEKLKEVLGEYTEEDKGRYNFTWKGKSAALRLAQTPSTGTLRPCKEESKNWDSTENLYIEGDNMEVLKLLQKSYYGKIKMIYIDPPYNTGKDFVYKDNYKDNLQNYLELTKQIDSEGKRTSTNSDTHGRYHTNWLNMIYPRLRLARNLLKDDGVIFLSIDDNELENLKKICNEVFGEENFIAVLPILSNPRGRQSSKFVAETHEYVLMFAKSFNNCLIKGLDLNSEQKKEYNKSDEFGFYRELGLRLRGGRATAEESPTLHFPIYYSITNNELYTERTSEEDYEIIPKFSNGTLGTWRWSKEKINENKKFLVVKKVKDRYDVFQKDYLTSDKSRKVKSLWHEKEINYDRSADELRDISLGKVFSYAKPLYMLKKILKMSTNVNSIVLDFFSGSATAAHAVMQLNAEDKGNRKFIMIQLPEVIDEKSEACKAGYKNICEIGKERIHRAGDKIVSELQNNGQTSLDGKKASDLDIGFKVFKLDSSNLQKWDPDYENLKQTLLDSVENLVPGRSELDLVYEVMLKYGIDLTLPVEEFTVQGKKVYSIGFGALLICLEDKITADMASEIIKLKEDLAPEVMRVVFKDNGFLSDSDKTNFKETLKTNGIEEFVSI
ncbi:DNA methylase [anaerobic digester metagenome]